MREVPFKDSMKLIDTLVDACTNSVFPSAKMEDVKLRIVPSNGEPVQAWCRSTKGTYFALQMEEHLV